MESDSHKVLYVRRGAASFDLQQRYTYGTQGPMQTERAQHIADVLDCVTLYAPDTEVTQDIDNSRQVVVTNGMPQEAIEDIAQYRVGVNVNVKEVF